MSFFFLIRAKQFTAEDQLPCPFILATGPRTHSCWLALTSLGASVYLPPLQKIGMVEVTVESVEDLLKLPTQYRLINHLSVDQFARLVGKNARQILRYEEEDYSNINIGTFTEILQKLPIEIKGKAIGKKATA